jgi:hypothetical protein
MESCPDFDDTSECAGLAFWSGKMASCAAVANRRLEFLHFARGLFLIRLAAAEIRRTKASLSIVNCVDRPT